MQHHKNSAVLKYDVIVGLAYHLQPKLVIADREVPIEKEHALDAPLPHSPHSFPVFLLPVYRK